MPYNDHDSLPDHIKAKGRQTAEQWRHVWNSAYDRCQGKGGTDCEGHAFRQANGVITKGDTLVFWKK